MADPPLDPSSKGDTGIAPDGASDTITPRWVYVFGVVAIVLVLLFIAVHLTGGGLGGHRR